MEEEVTTRRDLTGDQIPLYLFFFCSIESDVKMSKYIHYGSSKFKPELFGQIHNREIPWNKPQSCSGLWGSPVESYNGWKDWCLSNGVYLDDLNKSFIFELSSNAKILSIHDDVDLGVAVFNKKIQINECSLFTDITYYIDFEQLIQEGYDAVEIFIKTEKLYFGFYGWDCDSILVLNPESIIV